jgi:hypothetical protein
MEATAAERAAAVSDVLDRLVAAKLSPAESAGPQRIVKPVELKPDEDVLSKLTEEKQGDIKPPTSASSVEPGRQDDKKQQPDKEKQADAGKEILDKLVEDRPGDDKNG